MSTMTSLGHICACVAVAWAVAAGAAAQEAAAATAATTSSAIAPAEPPAQGGGVGGGDAPAGDDELALLQVHQEVLNQAAAVQQGGEGAASRDRSWPNNSHAEAQVEANYTGAAHDFEDGDPRSLLSARRDLTEGVYDDNYYKNKHRKGAKYGGSCKCPNGQTYQVSDNKDSCKSMQCYGGVSGTCQKDKKDSREGMRVDCGKLRVCRCNNGQGTTGKYCAKNAQLTCQSCYSGYRLVNSVCQVTPYVLGVKGANGCPTGYEVSKDACLGAAKIALPNGATQGRTYLTDGSNDGSVTPPGCSMYNGDWGAVWNQNDGSNDGTFWPVCKVNYVLASAGSCVSRAITTMAECETAAIQLRLSDNTPEDDGQDGVSIDPPFCYFGSGSLKFNDGSNTGSCSTIDKCLCKVNYMVFTSGSCISGPITTLAECGAAATELGLSDQSPTDDGQDGSSSDPPFCYFEGGSLKFNDGSNTGSCSTSDSCLCKAWTTTTTTTATTMTTVTTTTTTDSQESCTGESCSVYSDPHVSTFDALGRNTPDYLALPETVVCAHRPVDVNAYETGDFWIVKAQDVQIQGRFVHSQEFVPDRAALGAVVVAGPALRGERLLLEPMNGRIVWAGQRLDDPARIDANVTDDLLELSSRAGPEPGSSRIEAALPQGLQLVAVRFNRHLDMKLTMPKAFGARDGLCGNGNGIEDDDAEEEVRARMGSLTVAPDELLFEGNMTA